MTEANERRSHGPSATIFQFPSAKTMIAGRIERN
jgi:hypothetical protein